MSQLANDAPAAPALGLAGRVAHAPASVIVNRLDIIPTTDPDIMVVVMVVVTTPTV